MLDGSAATHARSVATRFGQSAEVSTAIPPRSKRAGDVARAQAQTPRARQASASSKRPPPGRRRRRRPAARSRRGTGVAPARGCGRRRAGASSDPSPQSSALSTKIEPGSSFGQVLGRRQLVHHAAVAGGDRLAHALAQRLGVEVHREHEQVLGLLRLRAVHPAAQASPVVERQRDLLGDLALADALQRGHEVVAFEIDAVVVEGLRELRVELGLALRVRRSWRSAARRRSTRRERSFSSCSSSVSLALGRADVELGLRDELPRALEQRGVGLAGLRARRAHGARRRAPPPACPPDRARSTRRAPLRPPCASARRASPVPRRAGALAARPPEARRRSAPSAITIVPASASVSRRARRSSAALMRASAARARPSARAPPSTSRYACTAFATTAAFAGRTPCAGVKHSRQRLHERGIGAAGLEARACGLELRERGLRRGRTRPRSPRTAAGRSGSRTGSRRARTRRCARRAARPRRAPARAPCTRACPSPSRPSSPSPTSPGRCARSRSTVCDGSRFARFSSATPPRRSTFASPQSTTCTSPKAPTMTFAGLRSRWTTPLRVRVGDRLAHRLEDREQAAAVVCAASLRSREQRGERAPLHELHREVRDARRPSARARTRARCPDAGAVRRSAPPRRSAARPSGRFASSLVEHLHRDVAPEIRVVPLQDHAHAAARDLAEELVVAAALRHELRRRPARVDERRRHRAPNPSPEAGSSTASPVRSAIEASTERGDLDSSGKAAFPRGERRLAAQSLAAGGPILCGVARARGDPPQKDRGRQDGERDEEHEQRHRLRAASRARPRPRGSCRSSGRTSRSRRSPRRLAALEHQAEAQDRVACRARYQPTVP